MECEVCGSPEGPFVVLIEGAKLHACGQCARMGKIISAPREPSAGGYGKRGAGSSSPAGSGFGGSGAGRSGFGGSGAGGSLSRQSPEFELADNFGDRIRSARLRMKLPLAVLAERLSEKESFLERIEQEKTHPCVELARHLEKELNVKLLEASEEGLSAALETKGNSGERTLGDIVEIKKKKKKEE